MSKGNIIITTPEKKDLKKGMETKLLPMKSFYKQDVSGICTFDGFEGDDKVYVYQNNKNSGIRYIIPLNTFIENYIPNPKFIK